MVFAYDTSKDAALFEDVKGHQQRYVGTQAWNYAAAASRALETFAPPKIKSAVRPTKTDSDTGGFIFQMEVEEWKLEYNEERKERLA